MRSLLAAMGLALIVSLISPGVAAEERDRSPSHVAAAEELLDALHLDAVMAQAMDVMLKSQLQQHPELVKVEDVMRTFLAKYLSYDALKPELARIYMDAFSEKELREISSFYRTDTGRKAVALMPSLFQKGAALGSERVAQHLDELKAAVETRLKELQDEQDSDATRDGD